MAHGSFPFRLGSFDCHSISDRGSAAVELTVLLVSTGSEYLLVDTGAGRSFQPNWGFLVDRLNDIGLVPNQIDAVVFSHADWDHVGGATDEEGAPLFSRARYVIARQEWEYWAQQPERLPPSADYDEAFRQLSQTLPQRRLAELRDTVEIVEFGTEILAGVFLMAAPGHTPGSAIVTVQSGGDQLFFIGDLILSDPQVTEDPSW